MTTIRRDTVFIPYHWAGAVAANLMTVDALDPISQDPRVQGVRVPGGAAARRSTSPAPPGASGRRRSTRSRRAPRGSAAAHGTTGKGNGRLMIGKALFIDPGPVHRLPGLRRRMPGVRLPQRPLDDPPRLRRRRAFDGGACRPCACTARTRWRPCAQVCPADAILVDSRRRRAGGGQGAVHRLRQLRPRLPVRRAEDRPLRDAPVQVRPLLRPHLGGTRAHVRGCLPHRLRSSTARIDELLAARPGAAATDIVGLW